MPLFIRPNAFREKIAQWKQQKLEIFWKPDLFSSIKFNRNFVAIYEVRMD